MGLTPRPTDILHIILQKLICYSNRNLVLVDVVIDGACALYWRLQWKLCASRGRISTSDVKQTDMKEKHVYTHNFSRNKQVTDGLLRDPTPPN